MYPLLWEWGCGKIEVYPVFPTSDVGRPEVVGGRRPFPNYDIILQKRDMGQIKTLPVHSQIVRPNELPPSIQLPDGWQLSVHQQATYQAMQSGEYDVVFNTSMTGDGKSLAAYLPTLLHSIPLLAMYPTNELARDQELQLPTVKHKHDMQT